MRDAEKAVLRLLDEHDIWLSANAIAENISYSSDYVGRICRDFRGRGLLKVNEGSGDPFYRITDAGREFLKEEG